MDSALRRQPDRRGHGARIGLVLPGDVERGAMVGGSADDRQAERDVDAFLEMQRLQWDQGLVVVHAQSAVVARPGLGVEVDVSQLTKIGEYNTYRAGMLLNTRPDGSYTQW